MQYLRSFLHGMSSIIIILIMSIWRSTRSASVSTSSTDGIALHATRSIDVGTRRALPGCGVSKVPAFLSRLRPNLPSFADLLFLCQVPKAACRAWPYQVPARGRNKLCSHVCFHPILLSPPTDLAWLCSNVLLLTHSKDGREESVQGCGCGRRW